MGFDDISPFTSIPFHSIPIPSNPFPSHLLDAAGGATPPTTKHPFPTSIPSTHSPLILLSSSTASIQCQFIGVNDVGVSKLVVNGTLAVYCRCDDISSLLSFFFCLILSFAHFVLRWRLLRRLLLFLLFAFLLFWLCFLVNHSSYASSLIPAAASCLPCRIPYGILPSYFIPIPVLC